MHCARVKRCFCGFTPHCQNSSLPRPRFLQVHTVVIRLKKDSSYSLIRFKITCVGSTGRFRGFGDFSDAFIACLELGFSCSTTSFVNRCYIARLLIRVRFQYHRFQPVITIDLHISYLLGVLSELPCFPDGRHSFFPSQVERRRSPKNSLNTSEPMVVARRFFAAGKYCDTSKSKFWTLLEVKAFLNVVCFGVLLTKLFLY